jgi:hypothetical protein
MGSDVLVWGLQLTARAPFNPGWPCIHVNALTYLMLFVDRYISPSVLSFEEEYR